MVMHFLFMENYIVCVIFIGHMKWDWCYMRHYGILMAYEARYKWDNGLSRSLKMTLRQYPGNHKGVFGTL